MVDDAGSIGGVLSPVLEVGKWLAAPIWRQFKYLYNHNTNFKNLEQQADKLKNTRDEVQRKVTAAERNVEEIKQNVKDWQKDVDKVISEAERLIQEKTNNPPCFKRLCSTYKQSKKAFKLKREDIDPLLQKEKEFDQVSFPTIPQDIWLRSNEDYSAFESRASLVKNVWDALNDENVYMIGVYGMAGLGKTTLVQEVGRKAEKDNLFEHIVFVEVTQNLDIEKVQTKIAEKLGIKFSNETERANKLYERLRSGKKILLILDNIWEDIDLKTISIPSKMDRGGCKLMFTTRDLDVLEKMGSMKNFKIDILAENEARDLFAKMTGDVIQTSELNSLANDVCKQCKGLPVVICAIAKALKTKTHPSEWKVALQELTAPLPSKFEGFLRKEYMKIALSYEYLRNDEFKKTFLICSLMENYTSISDLFIHVVCLDILEGANLTMEDARDRLDKLVRDLKDASLLLGEVTSKYFAMHDVIRDVAIIIAYVDHHVFTTKNDIERHWKNRDKLRKSTRISLPDDSNIIDRHWPDDLDFPDLEYFYMPDSCFNFPNDFFKVMPMLKVLNLAGLHQSSLPSSLHRLGNLQTLCLNDSTVEDVAIIGKLKKLKVLSLKYSNIKELPIEIGQLTELRLLDLSYCGQLHVIVPNVISKLLQLEEFHIEGCLIKWKVEVLRELKLLSNLTSVGLDVGNMVLHESLFAKEPRRYKISIGNYWTPRWSSFAEYGENERTLEVTINSIKLLEEFNVFENVEVLGLAEVSEDENYVEDSKFDLQSSEITPLFNEKVNFTKFRTLVLYNISLGRIWDSQISTFSQNLKQLKLERCGKMTYVFPLSIAKSLKQLQSLEIIDCEVLEKIVEEEEGAEVAVNSIFPQVTELVLISLPKLTIWDSQISTFSQNLKRLKLERFGKMTYVFPFSIAKSLRQLQSLEIRYCEVLEKIVEEEEGAEFVVNSIFPQVTELVLISLPKLTILYPGIHASEFSMFKRLEIEYCKNLTLRCLGLQDDNKKGALPISENKINHNLEDFELMNGARDITWQSEDKSLEILEDKSAYIPLGLLQIFQSVKKLLLYRCEYKEIKSVYNLPNLEDLRVCDCEKLMSLVPSSASLQNLKVLEVVRANALLTLMMPSTARSLMQLRELRIIECEMLLEIIENEGDTTTSSEIVFDNLKLLSLAELKSLVCFSSGNYSFNFSSLEELIIEECPNLKTFSRAMLNTPKLHSVNYEEIGNEGNDLNKIVRGLCKNKDEEISIGFKYKAFQDDNSTVICYDQHPTSFYQNLTQLIFWNCGNIKYAFPPTIARTLHQLQQLKIRDCMALEEIVAKEEGANAVVNFVFPNVTILKLENLPNLTTFYPEIHTLELPKLKKLVMTNCDKCLSFKSSIEESEIDSLDLKAIFLDDKINSHLEVFELRNGLAKITWQNQSKSLFISCDESAYISLGLLQRFHNLKRLLLNYCNYKEIKRPLLSTPFQNLEVLEVEGCNKFFNLMTPSMARNLVQLRELSISWCDRLFEIVENERDATSSSEQVVFNNLNKLSLKYLKFLSFFCSGNYSFNFPSLEELIIKDCPNMKYFCQGMLSTPILHKVNYEGKEVENGGNDLNSTIQQVHKEQVDSNIETLELNGRDIMAIWQGEFQKHFCEIETLELIMDEYTYIPIQILQKFASLENLILKVSSYEELFSFGEGEEDIGVITNLKQLALWGLFNLKCISKQDSQLNLVLQNLHSLDVNYCHNLTTLLLPSQSFENLRTLRVYYCNKMQNLMTSSTTKSLVCLESLSIQECEMMVEVLATEGDIENGEIVFKKLKDLFLCGMESLTHFYSGNYTLKFPFLEDLHVHRCSKMKTFSRGGLSMPRLQDVNWKDCSSDPNSVTQQLQNDCARLWERFPYN